MADGRLLLDTPRGDPLPQLLAVLLEGGGMPQPSATAQRLRSEDEIWFPSQHAFLSNLSQLRDTGCRINVVLRRASRNESVNADGMEHSVLNAVADRFPSERLKFHTLTEASRDEAIRNGFDDSGVLAPPELPALPTRSPATLDPGNFQILLHRNEGSRQIGLHAANWGRLIRDYQFTAAEDAALDWHDLAQFAASLPGKIVGDTAPLYVFITPNGVGVGHLTRQLAIARALQLRNPDTPVRFVFWSFSRAAIIAREAGHSVLLRHTAEHLSADDEPWQRWETAAFAQFLRQHRPEGVITDGSRVEPFIVDAMRAPGCHHARLFWVQRGMWQSNADIRGLGDILYCDRVLIPGDIAGEADTGATGRPNTNPPGLSETKTTPPVVLASKDNCLERKAARRALGLGRRRSCLVTLGGDAFARSETLQEALTEGADAAGIRLVWARSPLAAPPRQSGSVHKTLSLYPLSRYYDAFDGIVAAAGYNTFHELMLSYELPVLFIPTRNARLDDQPARARFAASKGWADILDLEANKRAAKVFASFFARLKSGERIGRSQKLRDGAAEMADEIASITLQERKNG